MSEQPYSGIALLSPIGEGERKGSLKKAYSVQTLLAYCGQQAFNFAVERKEKNERLKLTIATWNVRTLRDNKSNVNLEHQSAVIARELKWCNIDIAALSETHLSGQQSFEESAVTLFSSGVFVSEPQQASVGFAIKSSTVHKLEFLLQDINSHLMLLRLNFLMGDLISAYML